MAYLTQQLPFITFGLLIVFACFSIFMLRRQTECRLNAARKESLQQIINLKNLIKLTQNHRGISYRVLNSDPSRRNELTTIEKQIESLLSELNELNNLEVTIEYWTSFCDHWSRLKTHNLTISADNNLEQHNRLINVLLVIVEDLSEYGHWQDINPQGQPLQIQQLINLLTVAEWVGQARALGSGILASGNSTSVERIRMHFLKSKLLEHESVCGEFTHFPLTPLIEMIDQHLLAEEPTSLSSNEYFEIASRTIAILMERFDHIAAELTDRQNRQLRLYPEESSIPV